MTIRWTSKTGLEICLLQGRKSETDQIIEIRKGSLVHVPTLAEMGVILGLKGANEEREYPQEMGFQGWRKPLKFVSELMRHIAEDPDRDIAHIVEAMEIKYQIIRYDFALNRSTRQQTPTGQKRLF